MARWGITADLQFAEYARLSTVHPSGVTTRLLEFIECFDWIVKRCREAECEGLVIIGDIFDDRVSIPLPVLHLVCDAFERAAEHLKLHIVVGNHDSALRNPSINSLQVFKGIAEVYDLPTVVGELAFVPWTDDQETFGQWIRDVAEKGAEYLFTHAMVEGAVPMARGLPTSILCPDRFAMVWLGDVHDPVAIDPNIQYAGAPLQINFGDAGGDRGFWVLDTEEGWTEFVENDTSRRFHNVTCPDDARKVRDGDYVRVKSEDPKVVADVAGMLEDTTDWIESAAVEDEPTKPRLDVRARDTHEDVLRRYCRYQSVPGGDIDTTVAVGLEILNEVRG